MGMYTEFFYRADLLKETPDEVLALLDFMVSGKNLGENPDIVVPDHQLFKVTGRWEYMLHSWSAYFPAPAQSRLIPASVGFGTAGIAVHTNIKNYGSEIELFCDWIDPYVDAYKDKFLGYSLYEEAHGPELIFKKTDKPVRKWTGVLR